MAGVKGMKSPRARRPTADRFWDRVDPGAPDECWLWKRGFNADGYGRLTGVGTPKRPWLAHRLSYTMAVGPIPEGLHVLHRCDTPACVNPAHLFLGTHAENSSDKVAKGRQAKGEAIARARLNDEWVREIRSAGSTGRALARKYNVSPATISRVRRGHLWNHVQ